VIATITDEAAYMLSVAENVNRRDMTIMEEARAFKKVMGFGKTVAEVAERFGKTTAHISWRLGYLTLTDASAGALDAGFIGTEFAYYVAKLNPANQAVAIRRYIKGEFTTEGGAHAFAHALLVAEQQGPGFFEVAELTDDERAEKRTATRKARGDIDQIERAQGLLDDLAHKTPAELADLFETEVGSQLDKLDRLHAALMAARKQMRKARGISEARVYAVRDEVTAVAA
jgi:ParB family chromosome partitioning protein